MFWHIFQLSFTLNLHWQVIFSFITLERAQILLPRDVGIHRSSGSLQIGNRSPLQWARAHIHCPYNKLERSFLDGSLQVFDDDRFPLHIYKLRINCEHYRRLISLHGKNPAADGNGSNWRRLCHIRCSSYLFLIQPAPRTRRQSLQIFEKSMLEYSEYFFVLITIVSSLVFSVVRLH